MTDMQYREVEVRSVDPEKREICGLAVPFNEVVDVGGFREKFEPGEHSFEKNAPLFYGHDHRSGGTPIGRVTAAESTDQGVLVRAHISETPKGEEIYRLLKDGVLSKFSVGFEPVEHRMDDDVVVRSKTRFKEVSVVAFPAYATATVSEVRSETNTQERGTPVTDIVTEAADLVELRDTVSDLERRLAVMGESRDVTESGSQFRSAGELLKALATNDDSARQELRAFADSADADVTRKAWLQRPYKFIQEKRRLINVLSKAPLPSTGLSIEYPKVNSTTGTVAKQTAEGAALAYMEVSLGTGTATVGTYGGYSSVSRQAIERSDVNYLNAVFQFQAEQYAKATSLDVAATVAGIAGQSVALTGSLATRTAQDFLGWVVDAAGAVETNSLGLDGDVLVASTDVFRRLVTLVDSSGRPVFAVNGDGSNTVGNAYLRTLRANVAGYEVVWVPTLAVRTLAMLSSEAVTVLESPGAPFRLQDESVINLTKDFSLYGYMATTVNDANGIARATGLTA